MAPSVKGVADAGSAAPSPGAAPQVVDDDGAFTDDDLDTAAPGPGRGVRVTALVLSLLGLADSTYLTITHFQKQVLSCPTHGFINCLKVTTSPQSEVFGIPVAILGLAFYVAMTAVNLPRLWITTDVRVAWIRLAMAVSGIGFVLYLLYAELFIIKNLCEYCTGVHIITFALFVLIVTTFPSTVQRGSVVWDDGDDADEGGDATEPVTP
ncbi:MAG TPA: vitamin K epoxide reductase family protein [Acidimicrobiales bacterium]|nr:vitamin K epoxide reductase family protein [Acidimicrobiales bacterium]